MKVPIPSPLRALDRFLLLHAPNLQLTRIHFVLFYSVLAIVAAGVGAYTIPIPTSNSYYNAPYDVSFWSATIASLLATFYWMYLTLRDRKHHSFLSGARLSFLFFIYVLAVVAINAAPFIMSAVHGSRITSQYSYFLHRDSYYLGFASMIVATLAAMLNAGRSMAIRHLLISTVVVIALFLGVVVITENFPSSGNFLWICWLFVYAVSVIAVFRIRFFRRATPLSRFALVFLFTVSPVIVIVGAGVIAAEARSWTSLRPHTSWVFFPLGLLLTGVLAIVFEKSLTWLRALPE